MSHSNYEGFEFRNQQQSHPKSKNGAGETAATSDSDEYRCPEKELSLATFPGWFPITASNLERRNTQLVESGLAISSQIAYQCV